MGINIMGMYALGLGGRTSKKGLFDEEWKSTLGAGMIIGSTILDIFGQIEEREEMKEELEWEAGQRKLKADQLGTLAIEQLHDLKQESYYARGAARAQQASAGTKVGTGSALTQVSALEGQYRRKMKVISEKVGMERAGIYAEAQELEKRAKKAGETDWWGIGSSILQGGLGLMML